MSPFLELTLLCGLLLLFPVPTFVVGLWLIFYRIRVKGKLSTILFPFLMGIVAFETSVIGIAIDPRWNSGWIKLLIISGLMGIATFIFILVFTPIYTGILKIFRS